MGEKQDEGKSHNENYRFQYVYEFNEPILKIHWKIMWIETYHTKIETIKYQA